VTEVTFYNHNLLCPYSLLLLYELVSFI